MEDYEEFIQHRLTQLKRRESEEKHQTKSLCVTPHGSSTICFHGSSILPPLLSREQRYQMQGHREAARRMMEASRQKMPSDTRMSYVQDILHSVQLRQAPTLEEFFRAESELTPTKTGNIHHSTVRHVQPLPHDDVAVDSLTGSISLLNLTLRQNGNSNIFAQGPPQGSTSCAASTTNVLTGFHSSSSVKDTQPLTRHPAREMTTHTSLAPQSRQSILANQDRSINPGCVKEGDLRLGTNRVLTADMSHQSMSSGYVTCEDAEAQVSVILGTEGSPVSTEEFVLHSTSDTNKTNACEILSHPPVEAELLDEESVLSDVISIPGRPLAASSWRHDVTLPVCSELASTTLHPLIASQLGKTECSSTNDLVTVPVDQTSLSPPDPEPNNTTTCPQTETSAPDLLKPDQNHIQTSDVELDTPEGRHKLSLQAILQKVGRSQTELKSAPEVQAGDVDVKSEPPAGPYRLSLQTLLKKSQDHRRRQRQLKNQARSSSACLAGPQGTSTRPRITKQEEHGLSDKENEDVSQPGRALDTDEMKMADWDRRKDPPETRVQFSRTPKLVISPMQDCIQRDGDSHLPEIDIEEEKQCSEGTVTERWPGNGSTLLQEDSLTQSSAGPGIQLRLTPCGKSARSESTSHITHPKLDSPLAQENFYPVKENRRISSLPRPAVIGVSKFRTIPTPVFCMSPIRCKSKVECVGGESGRGDATRRRLCVDTPLNMDNEVGSVIGLGETYGDQHAPVAPLVAGGGVIARTAPLGRCSSDQAQQIAQLELNLSSLKTVISELESTLTETQGSQQTDRPDQTDCTALQYNHMAYRTPGSTTGTGGDLTIDPVLKHSEGSGVSSADQVSGGGKLSDHMSLQQATDGFLPPANREEEKIGPGHVRNDGRRHRCVTSITQKMKMPGVFWKVPYDVAAGPNGIGKVHPNVTKMLPSCKAPTSVLCEASNAQRQSVDTTNHREDSAHCLSVNESYDVDTPSGLWLQEVLGSEASLEGCYTEGKQLTPENGAGVMGGASRAKRRLVMHAPEGSEEASRPQSSTPKAAVRSHGQPTRQEPPNAGQVNLEIQLKQSHAAQVRALKEEQKRQQQELLQTLSFRYQQLQSLSFPVSSRPTSYPRLGGETTSPLPFSFPPSSSPSGPPQPDKRFSPTEPDSPEQPPSLPMQYRPLVAAAVKGFLTRRLLRTERVGQLLRTIKDTQQFLQAVQPQTPGREFSSKQDLVLQSRVMLQLRSARYEIQDIFCLPPGERMKIIRQDRQLARERDMRHKAGRPVLMRVKGCLSAATQKTLERKRATLAKRKAAEKKRVTGVGPGAVTGQNRSLDGTDNSFVKPTRGSFQPNPQRVPKTKQSRRSR
ncbi:hypothetical protein UPYG_G00059950 [Umbra pygmaea]|uniref:Uncharacterized protein n=1 Tax=Umbra pygmaea TaxID=75934 RepID=A0ABD0X940_UMBPY